jgi:hypothetical protein
VKKILGISLLSAVGLLAQGTAPANPPAASTTPAPAAKAKTGKKHHQHNKATTPATQAPAGTATPAPAAAPVK